MKLSWFRVPRDVVFGEGTLEYLKEIKGSKAFICTGTNPREATVEDIMEIYKAAYYGNDLTI